MLMDWDEAEGTEDGESGETIINQGDLFRLDLSRAKFHAVLRPGESRRHVCV